MAIDIKSYLKPDFLMKLPTSKKLLVLAGINIVIILIAYQFVLSAKQVEIKELNEELDKLTTKLEENLEIAKDIPKYQKEKEELEAKLEIALKQLPNEKEIDKLIESIHFAGKNSGLDVLTFFPDKVVRKGFYAEVPVRMTVSGSYESLYDFCEMVGNLPRIVNISGLSITVKGAGASLNPELSAQFVATSFMFLSQ